MERDIQKRPEGKLKKLRKALSATASIAIIACGYPERTADATQPPPIPPPAVSEYQRPTPPAELVPTTEVPSPPPTIEQQTSAPTPEPIIPPMEILPPMEQSRIETLAIYSQIMDAIEANTPEDKRYFVKIGEKGKYQDRALIFTEPFIRHNGEKVWVAITRDGPKSFSLKDSFFPPEQLPNDYIETFIKKSMDYLKEEPNDYLPYNNAKLFEGSGKFGREIVSLDITASDAREIFTFRDVPPAPYMIEEVIRKSQETAGINPQPPMGLAELARKDLERAKDLAEALAPHIIPNPLPSKPPISQSY